MINKHVKSTNLEMTEAISSYLDKKIDDIQKFLHKFDDVTARIEVGRTTNHHHKGDVFRAEINLEYGKHKLRAEATTNDLYKAIDTVKDEITAEITRETKKGRHLLRRGHQKIKNLLKSLRG